LREDIDGVCSFQSKREWIKMVDRMARAKHGGHSVFNGSDLAGVSGAESLCIGAVGVFHRVHARGGDTCGAEPLANRDN